MESLSISGLVLHTFHVLAPYSDLPDMESMDSDWVRSLPSEVWGATYKEVSGVRIEVSPDNNKHETIRHYVLPWALLATVDAYKNANWPEKAHALDWIDRLIKELPELQASTGDAYWISTELLIALLGLEAQSNRPPVSG